MLSEIYHQFSQAKSWEERYRVLIQLSRKLPQPTDMELAQLPEIHGCESRLWFEFQLNPRQVTAYSDARLMQGLLMIIRVALLEKSPEELQQFDLISLFEQLQITRHLTSTRLNGIQQIQQHIKAAVNGSSN